MGWYPGRDSPFSEEKGDGEGFCEGGGTMRRLLCSGGKVNKELNGKKKTLGLPLTTCVCGNGQVVHDQMLTSCHIYTLKIATVVTVKVT